MSNYQIETNKGFLANMCGHCWNKLSECPCCSRLYKGLFNHGSTSAPCDFCGTDPMAHADSSYSSEPRVNQTLYADEVF